ncbi:unnamed protein product [Anisakis simplex]|uniref:Reverse transcriptase domain-containing protein n=1 Tax=Anisakis simplex TaxID=6269 RepID=A0A0M3JN88_ANISI|nr:unnamed protein product [Anisakis simplex]
MGEYQEYLKGLEAIGRAPPRDVEPQTFRPLAFGNPFKVDKVCKSIAVDEVGEGNILGVASKGDTHKKRSNSSSVTSQSSSRPPRRKPGPLARNALSLWRYVSNSIS